MPAPLQKLRDLAKAARGYKPTPQETAELVALRLAQANGAPYRPQAMSPLARLQALEQAGFDIDKPRFYMDRIREGNSPMYRTITENWDIKDTPAAAMERYNPSTDELMYMLGEVPENTADSYFATRMGFDQDVYDWLMERAKIQKDAGMDPTNVFNAGSNPLRATFMVYPRKGAMKQRWNWWEQPYSTNDLVPVFGYPDDAGKFKRGGRLG